MMGRGWILVVVTVALAACSKSAGTTTPVTSGPETTTLATSAPATSAAPSPSAPETSAPGGALSGTWNGTYDSKLGVSGTFTATFVQTGDEISGDITIKGSPCVSHGTVKGSVTGSSIEFGAVQAERTVSFKGTLSGDRMSGTFDAPDCGPDSGTWNAQRG